MNKDLKNQIEEASATLSGKLERAFQAQGDLKNAQQGTEQMRESAEFRLLAAIADESRTREAAVQREAQARIAFGGDLENKTKELIRAERQVRDREIEGLAAQVQRCEEMLRQEREAQQDEKNRWVQRFEETTVALAEEANRRRSELAGAAQQLKELNKRFADEQRAHTDAVDATQGQVKAVEAMLLNEAQQTNK